MSKLHVKTGDLVMVMSGRIRNNAKLEDANKEVDKKDAKSRIGKVLEVSPKEGKVIVEGQNFATKHVKPRKQGQAGGQIRVESPIYACKVMPICPKCDKPTRVGHTVGKDGKKVRTCRKCGASFNN